MTWEYKLERPVTETTEDIVLWQSEKGVLEISKHTLAVPVKFGDKRKGYVFHGRGKLLVDAIVETAEGAVGKSIEKEVDAPFLMFGNAENVQNHLADANCTDFAEFGYEDQQKFLDNAEGLCDRFFKYRISNHESFDEDHDQIFVFPNEANRFDILASKGSRLVYKTTEMVFVSNESNNAVLKSPSEVVVASNGKSFVIKEGKSVFIQ
jgi:hypothetical protein